MEPTLVVVVAEQFDAILGDLAAALVLLADVSDRLVRVETAVIIMGLVGAGIALWRWLRQ